LHLNAILEDRQHMIAKLVKRSHVHSQGAFRTIIENADWTQSFEFFQGRAYHSLSGLTMAMTNFFLCRSPVLFYCSPPWKLVSLIDLSMQYILVISEPRAISLFLLGAQRDVFSSPRHLVPASSRPRVNTWAF
jgi:hypothetical protein